MDQAGPRRYERQAPMVGGRHRPRLVVRLGGGANCRAGRRDPGRRQAAGRFYLYPRDHPDGRWSKGNRAPWVSARHKPCSRGSPSEPRGLPKTTSSSSDTGPATMQPHRGCDGSGPPAAWGSTSHRRGLHAVHATHRTRWSCWCAPTRWIWASRGVTAAMLRVLHGDVDVVAEVEGGQGLGVRVQGFR